MQTIIEQAGPADVPALVELMGQFYSESNYALDRNWAEGSFDRLLRDEQRGSAWIARRGAESTGYVVLTLRHSMELGGDTGVIDDLFVRPPFRRQGVGSALLSALFGACRRMHVAAVHVEVGPTNAGAAALYESFGMRECNAGRRALSVDPGSGWKPR